MRERVCDRASQIRDLKSAVMEEFHVPLLQKKKALRT